MLEGRRRLCFSYFDWKAAGDPIGAIRIEKLRQLRGRLCASRLLQVWLVATRRVDIGSVCGRPANDGINNIGSIK